MARKKKEIQSSEVKVPVVAERSGTTESGGTFHIRVMLADVSVNGQVISDDLASNALADVIEAGFKGQS